MAESPGYRDLLALSAPRRLALGAMPADLSDWLDYAAVVALLVFAWDEGPFVLALFALMLILPYVLVGPILVALLHRVPLRTLLVASNLGRAATTAALIFVGDTAILLGLVFIRASVDSVFSPVRQSAIKATTPDKLLPAANGLHQAVNQVSKIAGPALGGLLLSVVSPAAVFGINACLSIVAAAIMATVAVPSPPQEVVSEPFLRRTFSGVVEIRHNRKLRIAVVFIAVAYGAFYLYDALIALIAEDFGLDATDFGLLVAASGLGGVLGALIAGRMPRAHPLAMMGTGAGVTGVFAVAVGAAALAGFLVPLWLFLPVMIFTGGANALMLVPYRVVVQSTVPPDRIASVYAAGEAVSVVAMMAAPFIGSTFATTWGTGAAFAAGGVALLLLFGWAFLRPRSDAH
jgi:predicted MFS family arabinose efflux permease